MLTIPKEIVPRQMARGVRAAFDVRSAIPDTENITIGGGVDAPAAAASVDSARAPGGPSIGSGRGRAARHLERAAEGVRAPARSRHPRGEPERRDLAPHPGRGLVVAGTGGLVAAWMGGFSWIGRALASLTPCGVGGPSMGGGFCCLF